MTQLDSFTDWYVNLNKKKTAEVYAPHKPLTILYALSKTLKKVRWIEYARDRKELEDFIGSFINSKANCLYPIWRLQNDSRTLTFWEVQPNNLVANSSGDISVKQANEAYLKAGFSEEIYLWLETNPTIAQFLIGEIIEDNFPESLTEEILISLGLDLEIPNVAPIDVVTKTISQAKRDPLFPKKIMQAYDYRCSFCHLKIYQNQRPFPMEAAHIKWKARGGECHETNGLSLCPTHHYTFDKGIWSLDHNFNIILNPTIVIDQSTDKFFVDFVGKSILDDLLNTKLKPSEENIEWHRKNIFLTG
jgi:putative restriction endonuclease